jgi:hypothetical protein
LIVSVSGREKELHRHSEAGREPAFQNDEVVEKTVSGVDADRRQPTSAAW